MLSRPRKPPSNRLLPSASSRLTHQVKLTSSLSKTRLRKSRSRPPSIANTSQRRPGLHRRVDVAEVPLVRRQRPVRVLEPLPAQQDQLVLGERRVHVRQRDAVERQVPRGEPRVLPLVRHRHDVERRRSCATGRCARPAAGAAASAGSGRRPASGPRRSRTAACSTACPPNACRITIASSAVAPSGRELGVELVGLGPPLRHHLVEPGAERGGRRSALGCLRPAAAAAAARRSGRAGR